jgi:hypothetical protein
MIPAASTQFAPEMMLDLPPDLTHIGMTRWRKWTSATMPSEQMTRRLVTVRGPAIAAGGSSAHWKAATNLRALGRSVVRHLVGLVG